LIAEKTMGTPFVEKEPSGQVLTQVRVFAIKDCPLGQFVQLAM
jgi:hypothetical protein